MHLFSPVKSIEDDGILLSARVAWDNPSPDFPAELWFRFPLTMAAYINERADAFLIALLLTAMRLSEDIQVDGEVSPRLLRGLDDFQALFSLWRPGVLQKVTIQAEQRNIPRPFDGARAAAATFSGGLDSFYTLWSHLPQQCPEPSRQIRYVLTLSGIPGLDLEERAKTNNWRQTQRVQLDELGVELLEIDSNWEYFMRGLLETQISYAMPVFAAATALAELLHTFYLPGALNYANLHPDGSSPYSDPLLNNEILEIYPHGSALGRIDKLRVLQDWKNLQENLVVCFDHTRPDFAQNCGVCPKCLRTRMMIEMLGKTGEFKTFPPQLKPKDILLWGRWLEIGFQWETEVLRHCLRQRHDLLPWVLLSLVIGYTRQWLKKVLPQGFKDRIYQKTSPIYYRRHQNQGKPR